MTTKTFRLDEMRGGYATVTLCREVGVEEPVLSVTLGPLTGTEKQVAWAETLRADAVEAKVCQAIRNPALARQALQNLAKLQAMLQAWVDSRPTAKAWIDDR